MATYLPGITEKSRVLSGSSASSLVGVEHAFLFPVFSGVIFSVFLEVLAPALTARGPSGREKDALGLVFCLDWVVSLGGRVRFLSFTD